MKHTLIKDKDSDLYRVVAAETTFRATEGEVGGRVSGPESLSQEGLCWVDYDAKILGGARVTGNAWLRDRARVGVHATVTGDVLMRDDSQVGGYAKLSGYVKMSGASLVTDDAIVSGGVKLRGNTRVKNNACVSGAVVLNSTVVADSARVQTPLYELFSSKIITGNAFVEARHHILHFGPMTSVDAEGFFTRAADGNHILGLGCWSGTVAEFRAMTESNCWISANAADRENQREELLALADLCEARARRWAREDSK